MANLETEIQSVVQQLLQGNPVEATNGIVEAVIDTGGDDLTRSIALEALDEADNMMHALDDNSSSSGQAAALKAEMQNICEAVRNSPRGKLPPTLARRVQSCVQAVAIACATTTTVSNKAHALEHFTIDETVGEARRAQRETERSIVQQLLNPIPPFARVSSTKALVAVRDEDDDIMDARAQRRAVVAAASGVGVKYVRRPLVGLVRRVAGDEAAAKVDAVVQDAGTVTVGMGSGAVAMFTGDVGDARSYALGISRGVGNNTDQKTAQVVNATLQTGATGIGKLRTGAVIAVDVVGAVFRGDFATAGRRVGDGGTAVLRDGQGALDGLLAVAGFKKLDRELDASRARLLTDPGIDFENLVGTRGNMRGQYLIDQDGNNVISDTELATILRNNGYYDKRKLDLNGDGTISYNELAGVLRQITLKHAPVTDFRLEIQERLAECARLGIALNSAYDTNRDGKVDINEAARALATKGVTQMEQINTKDEFLTAMRAPAAPARAAVPAAPRVAAPAAGRRQATFEQVMMASVSVMNGDNRFDGLFDRNHNGTITLDEIRQTLKDRGIDSLQDIRDRNRDGIIDRTDLMMALGTPARPVAARAPRQGQ